MDPNFCLTNDQYEFAQCSINVGSLVWKAGSLDEIAVLRVAATKPVTNRQLKELIEFVQKEFRQKSHVFLFFSALFMDAAMLNTLKGSFERCGYQVCMPKVGDFRDELLALAPSCDCGLVIAPDQLLSGYTKIIEDYSRNIGQPDRCHMCKQKDHCQDTFCTWDSGTRGSYGRVEGNQGDFRLRNAEYADF